MRKTIILLTVGFLASSGCSTIESNINPASLRGPYRVEVYELGKPVAYRSLEAGSARERAVANWLTSHSQGWSKSLVTYAPGRLLIGESFNLNLTQQGLCVVNFQISQSQSWEQVVKQLTSAENAGLRALLDPD